jgi:hypothetical protein
MKEFGETFKYNLISKNPLMLILKFEIPFSGMHLLI